MARLQGWAMLVLECIFTEYSKEVITEIKIQNFKSVQDLTLPLGRFNVFIGANGSGKSNILEAIAFGGAASANKLDNEFLFSRGIRVSNAPLMKSAFGGNNMGPIVLNFKGGADDISFTIREDDKSILKWLVSEKKLYEDFIKKIIVLLVNKSHNKEESELTKKIETELNLTQLGSFNRLLSSLEIALKNATPEEYFSRMQLFFNNSDGIASELFQDNNYNAEIAQFLIYSPDLSSLRKLDDEGQIKPLGIKGEGLFNALQLFYESEGYGEATINELRKYLHIIEWFDDFEAVFDKVTGRHSLVVKDRHLPRVTLNQNNVNEGFLFLLFYISLFISKETPAFFAIDNIEASFHPKLCEELIKNLVELAKKHDKQVILTTHNPFVLDGLDLSDPEQKLFVVHRNADGETVADNISKAPKSVRLSEAWMRGYIGGQPETIS